MNEEQVKPIRRRCHICGGNEFKIGHMLQISDQGEYFYETAEPPKEFKPALNFYKLVFQPTRARYCVTCGNVQHFVVEVEKPKRKQKPKS